MQKSNKIRIILVVGLLSLNIGIFSLYAHLHPTKNHQYRSVISGPSSRFEQVREFMNKTPDGFLYQFSRLDPNNLLEEYQSYRAAYKNVMIEYYLNYTDFGNVTIIQNESMLEVVNISILYSHSPLWINSTYVTLYDAYFNLNNGSFPVISLENVLFIDIHCTILYWNFVTPYKQDGRFSSFTFQALINTQLEPILCPTEIELLIPV